MTRYDLAIIGSGPGGYMAGLDASRRDMKVCVIEKGHVGGTCLNRGCIPAKSLLHSAGVVKTVRDASIYGVGTSGMKIDFEKMVSRKDEVVLRLRAGVETLLRAGRVDLIRGEAVIRSADTISVAGREDVKADNVIIASGSSASGVPGVETDGKSILSSDDILDMKAVPSDMVIIGGGAIGCEFASLFSALGSKVTIVEMTDALMPGQSREVSRKLEAAFKKRGIEIMTSSRIDSVERSGRLKVAISGSRCVEAEKALVSVGRRPDLKCIEGYGGRIKTDGGRIAVDEYLRTGEKNIYAIGDCVAGPMLAHKASYDALVACDNIAGLSRKAEYSNIPNCIWTDPEIASVGLSEEEARARHKDAKIAKFPYLASGKALLMGRTEGFVKVIADDGFRILGVEIMGEGACELIAEAVLARTAGITIKEWAESVHGHPTLSETLQEALRAF